MMAKAFPRGGEQCSNCWIVGASAALGANLVHLRANNGENSG